MPDPVATFAVRLRSLRTSAGLTQDQLGERAGIDAREVRRYEAGERDPGLRLLTRLASALDVTIADLVERP